MSRLSNVTVEDRVGNQVSSAFSDAQRTVSAHPRASTLLLSAFALSPTAFFASFIHGLNRVLVIFARDPPVERFIQFVAHFSATNTEHMPNFCLSILTYLNSQSNARTPAVRFRTVQLIATILKLLPESAELPDDILESIQSTVFSRAVDRIPRVRAAAAGALCRMQTSGDVSSDGCTSCLIKMLNCDTSAAVRKAAIQAVAVTESTISHLIRRIRDTNVEVRRLAYETIAVKVHPRDLHQDEIIMILREGLEDRIKSVRETCRDKLLFDGWMRRACGGNIFDFVDILGCHGKEKEVLQALKVIFESPEYAELVQSTEIDVNNLTHDDVLILRGLCEAKRGDGGIDKYIPTTLAYSHVLKYYSVNEFASRHLLELCKSIDLSDEAGRKALEQVLCKTFLSNHEVAESVIGNAVRALKRVITDEVACSRLLLEIIRHDVLELEEGVESQQTESVSETSETEESRQLEKVDDGRERWRCKRALNLCLETFRLASQSPTRSSAKNTLYFNMLQVSALPNIMSHDEQDRLVAMECLGLFGLLDRSGTEAKSSIPLFIRACQEDVPQIQRLALKIIIDTLMLFAFEEDQEDGSNSNGSNSSGESSKTPRKRRDRRQSRASTISADCLAVITESLILSDDEIRAVAAQGIARLLHIRRIAPNVKLIVQLLVLVHDPTTENNTELRQCLSMFFPVFAAASALNRLVLEDAFELVIKLLMNAPEGSSLKKISVLQVSQFIIALTGANVSNSEAFNEQGDIGRPTDQIHERLAEYVMNEIIGSFQDDNISDARLFAKILSNFRLSITSSNDDILLRLMELNRFAIAEADDRRVMASLGKFLEHLKSELSKKSIDDQEESSKELN